MLTSKEIIERTGISRATLNNYISTGLVPRPQVLPPGPEHGAAPRIGYFPDDTITRIETIQRLKSEGWSISRIADLFAKHPPGAAAAQAQALAVSSAATPLPPFGAAAAVPADAEALRLSLRASGHPAYLVDDGFRIVWANDAAGVARLSPLAGRAREGNVFAHLLALDEAGGREAIVRFHLEVARNRAAIAADLGAGLSPAQAHLIEQGYREAKAPPPALVTQARIPAAGTLPARTLYAVQFREGVLFAYVPGGAAQEPPGAGGAARNGAPAPVAPAPVAPAISSMAIVFATLQDAAHLWVKLSAQEYFELVNEVWSELDPIFRRHQGRHGRHPDEGVVCYFLPQRDGSYLWNALAAAHEAREAMHQVSLRWQARKGWDIELCMNTGVEEGQDWLGSIGAGDRTDLRVLGDAADRAEQLSRCSRMGAVLVTRRLLGKLAADERQRVTYGVPRFGAADADGRLLFSFARLQDIAPAPMPPRVADLAVAELVDLQPTPAQPGPRGAG